MAININKNFKLILAGIFFLTNLICQKVDPFSKIKISSNQATVIRDQKDKKLFTCKYLTNVLVEFADESKIRSDELEIIFDSSNIKSNKKPEQKLISENKNSLDNFKKITFKNNVKINSQNRSIKTDCAELYLSDKKVKLLGNVSINQAKEKQKDLPLQTSCNEATLDLQNEQITLVGDSLNPVSTTIELENHSGLIKKLKNKDEKTKKYHPNAIIKYS